MKIVKLIILSIILLGLGAGVYDLWKENNNLEKKAEKVTSEYKNLKEENRELKEKIDYFQNPQNLVEEAKKNFNYRRSGEELMIIVPGNDNSTSTPDE